MILTLEFYFLIYLSLISLIIAEIESALSAGIHIDYLTDE